MTDLSARTATNDDIPGIQELLKTVFLSTPDEESRAAWRAVFEPERSLVIYDGDELVAHTGAFTRELSVPGATVPAAHVTMVGTAPTHRRRGLLSHLMRAQLDGVPEPVAALWASEGRIYPRYGYGMATERMSLRIDAREVRLPEPDGAGTLRTVSPDRALTVLPAVYESVRTRRPGWSSRDEHWWSRILSDPPAQREGATERRITVHEGTDGVDGYALWRGKGEWGPGGPEGEVRVQELVTDSLDAYLRLWRFLLSVDLTRWATMRLGSPADPLLHLANEPRRLGATLGDGLYIRLVDLPAALTTREYAAPIDAVIEVVDPLREANAGRWRLTAAPGKATCTRTDDPADLACDITDLGAAYLGGTALGTLGAAGRVRELTPGSLAAASAAFGWHRTPAGLETF